MYLLIDFPFFLLHYQHLAGKFGHTAAGKYLQPHQHCYAPLSGHSLLQYLSGHTLQLWAYTTFSGNPPDSLLACDSSLLP